MNTYRITVAYDGTAYRGWQRQENTELTVQGILERRISEIAGKKTVVSGSGRTDSGVHALGQECSLYLEQEIDMDSFKKRLNALLPEDIRVLDISREKRDFHARKSAVGKCYEYQIDLRDKMEVFHRKYRFHFPHPVDIAAMEKAAEYLMGTHDFSAFTDLKEHWIRYGRFMRSGSCMKRIHLRYRGSEMDFYIIWSGYLPEHFWMWESGK